MEVSENIQGSSNLKYATENKVALCAGACIIFLMGSITFLVRGLIIFSESSSTGDAVFFIYLSVGLSLIALTFLGFAILLKINPKN